MRSLLFLLLWPFFALAQSNPTSAPVCGNKITESGEECDDGNQDNYDACLNSCKSRLIEGAPKDTAAGPLLDPDVALRRAVLGTFFGPPGLGLIWGPSLGHFYAGETGKAFGRTFLRGGLVAAQIGIIRGIANQKLQPETGIVLSVMSSFALSGLVAADLIDAPVAVRRTNEKRKPSE